MKGRRGISGGTLTLDAQKRPCRGDTAAAGSEQVCVVLRHNRRGYRAAALPGQADPPRRSNDRSL
jgi:hypothetical protein